MSNPEYIEDKAEYLRRIAVKPKPITDNRLISPLMAKIIVSAAAALVLIVALGVIINGAIAKDRAVYESFYLRLKNLSYEAGPLVTYTRDLKSSELRALASTLENTLIITSKNFDNVLSEVKVDIANISTDATNEEASALSEYTAILHDAKLNGLLDRTFASATTLQISLILAKQTEILEKTSSESVRYAVSQSMGDLELLRTRFSEFSNKSN